MVLSHWVGLLHRIQPSFGVFRLFRPCCDVVAHTPHGEVSMSCSDALRDAANGMTKPPDCGTWKAWASMLIRDLWPITQPIWILCN